MRYTKVSLRRSARTRRADARVGRRRRRWLAPLLLLTGLLVGQAAAPGVAQAAPTARSGMQENGSSTVSFKGRWTTHQSTNALGGTFANLNATGESRITFSGTGIAWVSRRGPYGGIAVVYLDGKKKTTVDLYAAKNRYQEDAYRVTGLRSGRHTLRVVRTGSKNRASQGRNIVVDAFNVLDRVPPAVPTGVSVAGQRTGARLTWTANRERDLAAYRIYRYQGGNRELIGTTGGERTFLDIGLTDQRRYEYRIVAVDSSGNVSAGSPAARFTMVATTPALDHRYASCPTATVTVSTRSALMSAVASAGPGTSIALAPGRYSGPIPVTVRGTAAAPVWICGPREAVIDTGDVGRNGGIRVDSSSHLVIAGLSVRNSQKGISVIASDHVVVADTRVDHIGDEAIHLRGNTVDSTVVGNSIADTGLGTAMYGEGIYIGTAKPNWCAYNNCEPDRSDRNVIVGNDIRRTTAEQIEAKEGAVDGLIADNTMDGAGMSSHSDSLIGIQSSGWTITGNTGKNAPLDGVQVWEAFAGYGRDNVAYANDFGGTMPGYAVRLAFNELGNYVGCDTTIADDSIGISNKPCQL